MSGSAATSVAVTGVWPPFTAAQWQELEHQALIFKYLKAGLPVPPDLLAPIRKSFDAIWARFFHHPSLGCYSFYGKKVDPEPGRCRRTDGKKWRCSKDSYPNSKYCERHMNRSRHRSRKPVESKTVAVPQSLSTAASDISSGSSVGSQGFQNLPFCSIGNPLGLCFGSNVSQPQMEPKPYSTSNKDYRCLHGLKAEAGQHNFLPEASGSLRCLGINSTVDSAWRLVTSRVTSNPLSEPRNGAFLQSNRPQQDTLQDSVSGTVDAAMSKQHYFFRKEPHPEKQEHQSHMLLFDEGPKSKDLRSCIDYQRSGQNELSPTLLSMSTPLAPSEFFARSAHS